PAAPATGTAAEATGQARSVQRGRASAVDTAMVDDPALLSRYAGAAPTGPENRPVDADIATLVAWQKRHGFTQATAPAALGVPYSTYRNWITGRARIIRPRS